MKRLFVMICMATTAISSAAAQSTSTSVSDSTSVSESQSQAIASQDSSVPRKQRIQTTPAAVAPGLAAAGAQSCAGSSSMGVAVTGFGFGFGSTREMRECSRRAYAASLASLGQNLAALDLLCKNDEVRQSLNASGVICPSQQIQAVQAPRSNPLRVRPATEDRVSRGFLLHSDANGNKRIENQYAR